MNLDTLTLVAFYFHPDLDAARARLATAEAGVTTASTRPNPTISAGGGYTDSKAAPYVLRFGLDWLIETAGKREYRTQRARNLTQSARLSLGEAAWEVRSRVRSALLDHLLASCELDLAEIRSAESQAYVTDPRPRRSQSPWFSSRLVVKQRFQARSDCCQPPWPQLLSRSRHNRGG